MNDGQFQLSFQFRFPEQKHVVCYFSFCYPFSYEETQQYLQELDEKLNVRSNNGTISIYYHRELICKSIDNLRVDLITVSSHKGILEDLEPRLSGLFPDLSTKRANRFEGKKVNCQVCVKNGFKNEIEISRSRLKFQHDFYSIYEIILIPKRTICNDDINYVPLHSRYSY